MKDKPLRRLKLKKLWPTQTQSTKTPYKLFSKQSEDPEFADYMDILLENQNTKQGASFKIGRDKNADKVV